MAQPCSFSVTTDRYNPGSGKTEQVMQPCGRPGVAMLKPLVSPDGAGVEFLQQQIACIDHLRSITQRLWESHVKGSLPRVEGESSRPGVEGAREEAR